MNSLGSIHPDAQEEYHSRNIEDACSIRILMKQLSGLQVRFKGTLVITVMA